MNQDDVRFYSYLFVRRLPIMTAVGALIAAGGLAYILSLPPVYEATATILVKSPEIPTAAPPGTETVGALTRLQVIQQELLTYDALLALADRHKLYLEGNELSSDRIVADLRDRIALGPVLFGGENSALGFSVSFSAAKPALAAEVTNDLVRTILDRDVDERASGASETVSFFQNEVDKLAQDLAAIETRVQIYKTQHLQALPDTLEFRRMLQINLRDRMLVLEREQSSLQSRRANYVQFYRRTDGLAPGSEQSSEQRRLDDLKQALASQSMLFSADSPAIQSLKSQIAAAEASARPRPVEAAPSDEVSSEDPQLAEMDARLAAIALERESMQRSDNELTSSIAATPANEAALSGLEREHEYTRTLYTAAAARLADASTDEQIERELKGERLVLMEPARAPERPSGPKRFPIALAVAAAALAGALAAAILPELLNRKVRRATDIEKALNIEVLACIPNIPVRPPISLKLPTIKFRRIGMAQR